MIENKSSHEGLIIVGNVIEDDDFWKDITNSLRLISSMIESSLLLKSAKFTSAVVVYCFARHAQTLVKYGKTRVLKKLCELFETYKFPLLFPSLFLHAIYAYISFEMVGNNVVSIEKVVRLIVG